MLTLRVLATAASAALLLAISPTAQAVDLVGYRGLRLGMTLVAAGNVPGTVPGEATVIHKRPALLQELRWRPGSTTSDSVQEALLGFFNGELSRIVVTYDRYRVEGLTSQDMIDGISQIYGSAPTPTAPSSSSSSSSAAGVSAASGVIWVGALGPPAVGAVLAQVMPQGEGAALLGEHCALENIAVPQWCLGALSRHPMGWRGLGASFQERLGVTVKRALSVSCAKPRH